MVYRFSVYFLVHLFLIYHISFAIYRPKIYFGVGLWLPEQIPYHDKLYLITLIRRSQQILFNIQVKSCCSVISRYYLFKMRKTRIIVWQNIVLSLSPAFFNSINQANQINRKIFYSHTIFISLQIYLYYFRSMLGCSLYTKITNFLNFFFTSSR